MKALVLAFHRQMTNHWVKFGKIAKELIAKRVGGQALFSFVEFLLNINLPISIIILPAVQLKVNFCFEGEILELDDRCLEN
jgi:hypothetical protein